MKLIARSLLTLLLIMVLVNLGLAQGVPDFCPPECAHCSAQQVPPCCSDNHQGMQSDHLSHHTPQPGQCERKAFCHSHGDSDEVIAVVGQPSPDQPARPQPLLLTEYQPGLLPPVVFLRVPIPPQLPALYDLNCSYLI